MLSRLPPDKRILFQSRCCQLVSGAGTVTKVTGSTGTVNEVYLDLMLMHHSYGLKLETMLDGLVDFIHEWERAGKPAR